jgi:Cu/Ag efflux pump CusA
LFNNRVENRGSGTHLDAVALAEKLHCVVLASLVPILWETGLGADVMKPIAAPIVGGMITSTIHVLILLPVFFALMKPA